MGPALAAQALSTTAGSSPAGRPSTAAATPPRSSRWSTSRSWPASASPGAATPRACPSSPPPSSTTGTEEQKERFALPTLRAEISWCLGMSEPNAGSDLAGLRTRAELHGDHFVVNGQKVWTSGAHHSDYCFCFVRTDPEAAKHAGISVLIIDMKTPGIETRPIAELTDRDHADFNEVFFTDVDGAGREPGRRAPPRLVGGRRLPGPRAGDALDQRGHQHRNGCSQRVVDHRHHPPARRPSARRRPHVPRHRGPGLRPVPGPASCSATGASPSSPRGEASPEHSVLKLLGQRTAPEPRARRGRGPRRRGDSTSTATKRRRWPAVRPRPGSSTGCSRFSGTIAGGTSEIQRNIIAERVLGLPRR